MPQGILLEEMDDEGMRNTQERRRETGTKRRSRNGDVGVPQKHDEKGKNAQKMGCQQ